MGRVAGAALLLITFTSCDPPPPPAATFTVNSTAATADALPGDGVCEIATGNGVCTLPAAVAEGNAAGSARILLAHSRYAESAVLVTGDLTISAPPGALAVWVNGNVTVSPGGSLGIERMLVFLDASGLAPPITVGGSLTARHSVFASWADTVAVQPGGWLIVHNGMVSSGAGTAVNNEGSAVLAHTTLVAGYIPVFGGSGLALRSSAGSSTVLGGVALIRDGTGGAPAACSLGAPLLSTGWNVSFDATCALSEPSDVEDAANTHTQPAWYGGSSISEFTYEPKPGGDLVDAIPLGTLGCGPTAVDLLGRPRAANGTAACDIGGFELQPG